MATINPVFEIRRQVERATRQALMQRRPYSTNPHYVETHFNGGFGI